MYRALLHSFIYCFFIKPYIGGRHLYIKQSDEKGTLYLPAGPPTHGPELFWPRTDTDHQTE